MPRFFESVSGDTVVISGENATHMIKSLRMKVGEKVTLSHNGMDYNCEITDVGETVTCKVLESVENKTEPTVKVTLFQCMPKGDKFETIVQKSVELGVDKIVPVLSSRCVSRPDNKSATKKVARYNKIAYEACKQCGRGKIVEVENLISFDEMLKNFENYDIVLMFYEGGGINLKNCELQNANIAILIGSEGGFDEDEVKRVKSAGGEICSLGPRILRAETAPLAALCSIMIHTENM